jgi:hypothetical protein
MPWPLHLSFAITITPVWEMKVALMAGQMTPDAEHVKQGVVNVESRPSTDTHFC